MGTQYHRPLRWLGRPQAPGSGGGGGGSALDRPAVGLRVRAEEARGDLTLYAETSKK